MKFIEAYRCLINYKFSNKEFGKVIIRHEYVKSKGSWQMGEMLPNGIYRTNRENKHKRTIGYRFPDKINDPLDLIKDDWMFLDFEVTNMWGNLILTIN